MARSNIKSLTDSEIQRRVAHAALGLPTPGAPHGSVAVIFDNGESVIITDGIIDVTKNPDGSGFMLSVENSDKFRSRFIVFKPDAYNRFKQVLSEVFGSRKTQIQK